MATRAMPLTTSMSLARRAMNSPYLWSMTDPSRIPVRASRIC
jgi:hypothetical protein